MLGQPPSAVDDTSALGLSRMMCGHQVNGEASSDDSITFATKAIERACGDTIKEEDPISLILEEKLDERDSMLMDGTTVPSSCRSLLTLLQ